MEVRSARCARLENLPVLMSCHTTGCAAGQHCAKGKAIDPAYPKWSHLPIAAHATQAVRGVLASPDNTEFMIPIPTFEQVLASPSI